MTPVLVLFRRPISILVASLALLAIAPLPAAPAGVRAVFDLDDWRQSPFPTDRFTVPDPRHNTGLRVDRPRPDCAARPSDCEDIEVLNTLDGFNLQPRLSIPFDGPIDLTSVTSQAVFLVRLGSTPPGANPGAKIVGINRVVWDPATTTLHVESDELLDQHTRYALIVTRGLRDATGDPVEADQRFERFRRDLNFGLTRSRELVRYRKALQAALPIATRTAGVHGDDVVAASVFTTLSATAILEKIRDQIKATTPGPADFHLGPGGSRTVFTVSSLTGLFLNRQLTTGPALSTTRLFPFPGPLDLVPGAVGHLAFGKYLSPDYLTADRTIPAVGTRTGIPIVRATSTIYFNLFLPSGPKPPEGWPVTIFGHSRGNNKQTTPFIGFAAKLAAQGIATIAINSVGTGFGPLSTLTLTRSSEEPVTFPAGGRGVDVNGDGIIESPEGLFAAAPFTLLRERDGRIQTAADLMQLARLIEVGIDVDDDGVPDLDPRRIYYAGNSLGAFYGTAFVAVEPSVRASVLNVVGGPTIEAARLSTGVFRGRLGSALAERVPSLINVGGVAFDENMPLRDQPPVVNTVAGAMEIQELLENIEWASQSADQLAYAPHLARQPLAGLAPRPVLIQFAKGDQQVPNPTTSAMLRAGDLADRAVYFRNDLFWAANPGLPSFLEDPHGFLTPLPPGFVPAQTAVALAAQDQLAAFLASDGTVVIDPDESPELTSRGLGPYFETPIVPPLPEDLSFIP